MVKKIGNYLSLIKFSHTIFALPFAMIGLFLGLVVAVYEQPGWNWKTQFLPLFIKVLLCMVFARSAAMAFNRWLDRRFDALNPRTAVREIPAGVIRPAQALVFTILSSVLFVATTWFINPLCFYLSFIAIFVVLFYSYTKRFTPLCHLVLGVGLSLAPIGAFLAVTAHFAILPLMFSFIVLCWVSGFDIIYALQDEEFDKEHGLYSIPSVLGKRRALWVSRILHTIAGLLVIFAGLHIVFGWIYWIGAAVFIGLLFYQHSLVSPKDLSRVNLAFATTNGWASMLFAIFTLSSLFQVYV